MMAATVKEITDKLMPLYEAQHDRFMRFYNAVYIMLSEMPEGSHLNIRERCREQDIPLFRALAMLVIAEEKVSFSRGSLSLEGDTILRSVGSPPSRERKTKTFIDRIRDEETEQD